MACCYNTDWEDAEGMCLGEVEAIELKFQSPTDW